MGHHTHHYLICLEGPLVADSCLGDHDSRPMSLVSLPHANVVLPPRETGDGQSRIRIILMHLLRALLAWERGR